MGKSALSGLKGVEKVTSGWSGANETNTVIYDPGQIKIREMEAALRRARTYIGTVR